MDTYAVVFTVALLTIATVGTIRAWANRGKAEKMPSTVFSVCTLARTKTSP